MNKPAFLNYAKRRIGDLFPGYFQEAKHNHYLDFGWPEYLNFSQLYNMYKRNGMGKAAVELTVEKTWQDMPIFKQSLDPKQTPAEIELALRLEKIMFWQNVSEVDRRSLVGGYAGLILRFADDKMFSEPVERVGGGLEGFVGVIPAWSSQLRISEWHDDQRAGNYGEPKMYQFNEAQLEDRGGEYGQSGQQRSFEVHPDRVVLWSKDGTVHCDSLLESGYNSLLDLEKVSGAGGEGFYKIAKSAPVLIIDENANLEAMAEGMGKKVDELADAMNEQVKDYNAGFDSMLLLQGMKTEKPSITLPSPQYFFGSPLMIFAASVRCPQKILVGTQTGERASTEDAAQWARTNKARRNLVCKPKLMQIIERLMKFGIVQAGDWVISWTDLTESSELEKAELADKMADINVKSAKSGMLVYLPEEIRQVTHDKPLGQAEAKYTGSLE